MSKKSASLPPALKTLLKQPTFPARPSQLRPGVTLAPGRSADPLPAPSDPARLQRHFAGLESDAAARGLGWGEWLSLSTATLLTLNSPSSLQALHRHAMSGASGAHERLDRALLMRETGLKCIGFIGIPKVINNLAALRSAVDAAGPDDSLARALTETQPRRKLGNNDGGKTLAQVHSAAYELWDDIYQPHSDKLLKILGHSHPDLPVFIVEGEYGPLFSMPHRFNPEVAGHVEPSWEVNRLRTSLVAIAALRAQGGVGPQVTSHVWGLLKAKKSIATDDAHRAGLEWLCSEEGSLWAVRAVDGICEAVEGAEAQADPQPKSKL